MDNTIDNLQIEIESSVTGGQRGLTRLKNSLEKLAEMSEGIAKISGDSISKLKAMADGVNALGNAGNNPGLSKAISELRKLSKLDFSGISAGSDKIKEIADAVDSKLGSKSVIKPTPIPTAMDETVEILPTSELMSQGQSFFEFFASVKEEAVSTGTALVNEFTIAFSIISRIVRIVKGAATAFFSTFRIVIKGAAIVSRIMTGNLFNNIKSALGKVKQFMTSIGRIAMYRMIRTLLSQISKAIKEGTQNMYQYSKVFGNTFAASMDKVASSFLYFKNAIGAAVAPLINALAPAIEYVIDRAVALINVLNQLFARITGASTWTKAVKTQTEYAEAVGGAADAVKSLIAGFDELNILSDSRGGGGASVPDYGSMFEEMELDSGFATWVDEIKQAINEGDWVSVGTILGTKVNEVIDSIDFANIGTKLGYGIQSAFEAIYHFLDTINFDNIGKSVATLLNNAFEQIDFTLVGKTFAKKWMILVDLIYGFVTTFDWSKFGLAIADFVNGWFEEIDITKAAITAQTLVLGLFTSLQQAIQNIKWFEIGAEIANALNAIDWISLFANFAKTVSVALAGALDFAIGFVKTLITNTDWNGLVSKAFELLGAAIAGATSLGKELVMTIWDLLEFSWNSTVSRFNTFIEDAGGNIIEGLWNGIKNALKNVGSWIKQNIFDPFITGFKNAFGIKSPSTEMEKMGGFIVSGLLKGIKGAWGDITAFFGEKLDDVKRVCSETWDNIKSVAFKKWDNIKSTLSTIWGNIKTTASTIWDTVKSSLSTTWNSIKSTADSVFGAMKTSVTNIWENLWRSLKGIINAIIGGVEKMTNGIINGINGMIRALNRINFSIPDWVPSLGGKSFKLNLSTISTISIPRLAKGGITNGPMMAVIGDNPGGREVVSPLDDLLGMIQAVVKNSNESGPINLNLTIKIGEDTITEKLVRNINRQNRIAGKTVIEV